MVLLSDTGIQPGEWFHFSGRVARVGPDVVVGVDLVGSDGEFGAKTNLGKGEGNGKTNLRVGFEVGVKWFVYSEGVGLSGSFFLWKVSPGGGEGCSGTRFLGFFLGFGGFPSGYSRVPICRFLFVFNNFLGSFGKFLFLRGDGVARVAQVVGFELCLRTHLPDSISHSGRPGESEKAAQAIENNKRRKL
jgi:hypothetical protein